MASEQSWIFSAFAVRWSPKLCFPRGKFQTAI